MKLSPLQLFLALALLFAAVICANIFAPGAVSTVTAMATTAFAALFVSKKDPPDPPASGGEGLKVLPGGLAALALALCLAGCPQPAKDPVQAAIDECVADARAAFQMDPDHDVDKAMAVYDACIRRAGLSS